MVNKAFWWSVFKVMRPFIVLFGILVLMGTDIIDDFGIVCVAEDDGILYAQSHSNEYYFNNLYASSDSGITWEQIGENGDFETICSDDAPHYDDTWGFFVEDGRSYRFFSGERIEVRSPNGATVETLYDITQYNFRMREIYFNRNAGPYDAVIDTTTGNIVMAMSLDGVLVITPEGEQIWSRVGDYRYQELTERDLLRLIDGTLIMALFLFLLTGSTLLINTSKLLNFFVGFWWIVWGILGLLYFPTLNFFNTSTVWIMIGVLIVFFIGMIRHQATQQRRVILPIIALSVAITLAFLLPYVVWIENETSLVDLAKSFTIAKIITLVIVCLSIPIANSHINKTYFALSEITGETSNRHQKHMPTTKNHDIDATVDPFESE